MLKWTRLVLCILLHTLANEKLYSCMSTMKKYITHDGPWWSDWTPSKKVQFDFKKSSFNCFRPRMRWTLPSLAENWCDCIPHTLFCRLFLFLICCIVFYCSCHDFEICLISNLSIFSLSSSLESLFVRPRMTSIWSISLQIHYSNSVSFFITYQIHTNKKCHKLIKLNMY